MKPDKPIYGKEGIALENTIGKLIGRHNVLCTVEEKFAENEIAKEYFERARDEVLDSGNQSYSVMLGIAIENMAEFIDDHREEENNSDIEKLKSRIYALESENRKLKSTLDEINRILA